MDLKFEMEHSVQSMLFKSWVSSFSVALQKFQELCSQRLACDGHGDNSNRYIIIDIAHGNVSIYMKEGGGGGKSSDGSS